MSAYGKTEGAGEVRKMGLGALVVRGALMTLAGGMLYASVLNPVMEWVGKGSAVVEQGYASPKSLSIQGRKNSSGNIETYLNYKNGEETVSLPCKKGPEGPLCGTVEYWWQSAGSGQREELVVGEWAAISNDAKYGVMSKELQKILDAFYGVNGVQKAQQQQPQQQYTQPNQK